MEPIVNKVAESEIEVFDLASLWDGRVIDEFDLAPLLDRGIVLREKDFRKALAAYDWSAHADHHVAVHCSTPAIVPTWAFMLVGSHLHGVAASVAFGTKDDLRREFFAHALDAYEWSAYADRMVVIKGCANDVVPQSAYVEATSRLQSVARKLMYGEPCSSVPLWRRPASPKAKSTAARPVELPQKNG